MTYTTEEKCWIWLATLQGVGDKALRKLVDRFGSAAAVRRAAMQDPESLAPEMNEKARKDMVRTLAADYLERLAAALDRRGITAITPVHHDYSTLLAELPDAPLLLYAKGDTSLMNAPGLIAMVGSRSATNYGKKCAYNLARDLALQGVVIVSGMARGVDSYAHQGALAAGGKTIAVLGSGVDVIYPPENEELYHQIEAEGLILSEYLPGAQPFKGHFPERNRIISGLSHGVMVLEGGEKSGSRITANLALDQGREVMAVPGNIDLPLSYTPNQLIREGCAMVTCADDAMIALGWREEKTEAAREKKQEEPKTAPQKKKPEPEPEEEPIRVTPGKPTQDETKIMGMLAMGPASFDEIYEALEFSPAKLGATLTIMAAKGMINQLPGKVYEING